MVDESRRRAHEAEIRGHFDGFPLAWEIFEACVAAMPMTPSCNIVSGVLTLRRWYPCMRVYPETDGLRVHVDLYLERKHPRLEPIQPKYWYAFHLSSVDDIDEEVTGWLSEAIEIGNMK